MSPKRGDDVPPPPIGSEWRLRFATNDAANGWGDLCAEAPGNTRRCYEALRADPASTKDLTASTDSVADWALPPSAARSTRSGSTRSPLAAASDIS